MYFSWQNVFVTVDALLKAVFTVTVRMSTAKQRDMANAHHAPQHL
jgi:hypothetical protein